MVKRAFATLLVAGIAALSLTATAPASDSDAVRGARCVAAGVRFLVENDLLRPAALRQIDYDTIDSDGGGDGGLINTDLPAGSFLPLGTVIRLHFTNPDLFDWCSA